MGSFFPCPAGFHSASPAPRRDAAPKKPQHRHAAPIPGAEELALTPASPAEKWGEIREFARRIRVPGD